VLGNARPNGFFPSFVAVDQDLIRLYEEALSAPNGTDSSVRSRLLAQLAVQLMLTPERDRRSELSREAIAIARQRGDAGALAQAINARILAIMGPHTLAERLTLAAELESLAENSGGLETCWCAASHRVRPSIESGDIAYAERMLARADDLASKLRQPFFGWWGAIARTMLSTLRGLPDAEQQALATLQMGTASGQPEAPFMFGALLAEIRLTQGRTGEFVEAMRGMVGANPHLPVLRSVLAYCYSEMDRLNEARAEFNAIGSAGFTLPVDWLWSIGATSLASVCAALHDQDAASLLYPRIQPFSDRVGVGGIYSHCQGSLGYPCGLLAACLEHWDDAERHFNQALEMNDRIGARPYQVRTRRAFAAMLIHRNARGDLDRAIELIDSAAIEAERLGMKREIMRLDLLHARAR
jgi:tetratricopeptide (TPR) repeat protein